MKRQLTIVISDEDASWIEEIHGKSFKLWLQQHVTDTVNGRELVGMPRHRISIAWHPEVYRTLLTRADWLDQSYGSFVRETIHQILHQHAVFRVNPQVIRSGSTGTPGELTPSPERSSVVVPLLIPDAWWSEMQRMGYTSSHVKAWVQDRLQRELNIELPVARGLQKFLDDPHFGAG